MKLSKTIIILALLTISSFGISAAAPAQDEKGSDEATAAFDRAVLNAIYAAGVSGAFEFISLPLFDPEEVLIEDTSAYENIIIYGDSLQNYIESAVEHQDEDSYQ